MSRTLATAQACGKIILFGEHAVVYGQPAIAAPVTAVRARASVQAAPPGHGFSIHLPEIERTFRFRDPEDGPENGLVYTARLVFETLTPGQLEHDLRVILTSDIPQKSGFGSGAAVSAAIARALGQTLGQPLAGEALNKIVYEVEKLHHGTPSGIDNTVVCYQRPLYFVKNGPHEFIDIPQPLHLLIGGLPHSTPTKVTVSDVRYLHQKHPRRVGRMFSRIGSLTRQARRAIESGQVTTLGPLLNENQRLLKRLTVSDEALDTLCQAAREAGAYGAKLSGGGRGGNMIALIDAPLRGAVSDALYRAGAERVFYTVLGTAQPE